MVKLRYYQEEGLAAVRQREKEGHKGAVLKMPTGSGKTIYSAEEAKRMAEEGRIMLFLAEREKLLDQAWSKILDVYPEADVGKYGFGKRGGMDHQIILGGVDTLTRPGHLEKLRQLPITYINVDECFPAGTLIDGKPIEDIKQGDYVTAFHEKTQTFTKKKVVRLFRKKAPNKLVKIVAAGREVICTLNHPFYTERGWKPAGELVVGERVLHHEGLRKGDLQLVPPGISCRCEMETRPNLGWEKCVLQTGMWQGLSGVCLGQNAGRNQSEIRIGEDEESKPHAQSRVTRKNGANAQSYGASAENERGQWEREYSSATPPGRAVGLENGIRVQHSASQNGREPLSLSQSLQAGHSLPGVQDSHRDRRGQSHGSLKEGTGPEKGSVSSWARVDRLEILKSNGSWGPRTVCPDGYVYNFEVEEDHTYIANGFVVHNCHHAPAFKYRRILNAFPDAFLLGQSATPERADGKNVYGVFHCDRPTYEQPILKMIAEGYLASIRCFTVRTQILLEGVTLGKDGDYNEESLAQAIDRPDRNTIIARTCAMEEYGGRDVPSVTFAANKGHAKALCEEYKRHGITAVCVLDDTGDMDDIYFAGFAKGTISMIVTVAKLIEGWDADVRRVVNAAGTRSASRYRQKLGRGIRPAPGKEFCWLLDFTDDSNEHDLEPLTLADVLELPELADGDDIREVIEKRKEAGQDIPGEQEEEEQLTFLGGEIVYKEKQLHQKIDWSRVNGGYYTTRVGDDQIILSPTTSGLYNVVVSLYDDLFQESTMVLKNAGKPLGSAQMLAEQYAKTIRNGYGWMLNPEDPRGMEPITPRQIKQLNDLKRPIPQGCTKAQAGALISEAFSRPSKPRKKKASTKKEKVVAKGA